MSRDALFRQAAAELGFAPDAEIVKGGNYVPLLRDGDTVSGLFTLISQDALRIKKVMR